MKKLLMLFLAATLSFISCKKADDIVPLPKPVLTMTNFVGPAILAGVPVKAAEFQYVVPAVNPFHAGIDISISGTLGSANVQNLSFVIKKKTDTATVVYKSPIKNSVSDFNSYIDWIPLIQNPSYVISVFFTTKAGSIGTVIITMGIESEWGTDGYDMTTVVGQTTTVTPYPRAPTLTYVDVPGTIDTSISKKKYTVKLDADTIMIKQVAYDLQYSSSSNDTGATQLKMYKNGNNITNRGVFTDVNGSIITILKKSDTKVYFTFTTGGGEDTAIGSNTYDIYWKDKTFEPFGVQFLTDNDLPSGYFFLNSGGTGNYAKLYSSKVTNSSAQVYNFIWSYFGHPHSGIAPFSTNDWRNGKGYAELYQKVWH